MAVSSIIFWLIAFLALIISIVILVRKVWLPYSKFLLVIIVFYIFLNFIALFTMPNWIKHIGFGIGFLIFPMLDGITTNIALTKYSGKETNLLMALVIKKIGIRYAMFIPFIFISLFVIFYWETTESSVLFGLAIAYFAVIINNLIVIRRNKKKLALERTSEP